MAARCWTLMLGMVVCACAKEPPRAANADQRPPTGSGSSAQEAPEPGPSALPAGRDTPGIRGILFSAQQGPDGNDYLSPVAIGLNGRWLEPVADTTDSAFAAFRGAFERAGQVYTLFLHGVLVGRATVIAPDTQVLCNTPSDASASFELDRPLSDSSAFALDSGPGLGHDYHVRALTAPERLLLLSLAQRSLRDSGAAPSKLGKLHLRYGHAFAPSEDQPSVLTATFGADSSTENETIWRLDAFLIADSTRAGYAPSLVWKNESGETDVAVITFADVLDIDGDGIPEIIAKGHYYESTDYLIYHRNAALGWALVYHGGWAGC